MNEADPRLGDVDRRNFLKSLSIVSLGVAMRGEGVQSPHSTRRRYAIVGVGDRAMLYQAYLQKIYRLQAEVVALCDINPGRLKLAQEKSGLYDASPPPGYLAFDFRKMIAETQPDVVIVTTPDATHDDYLVAAMEAGCDVISEKPLTTTAEKCQRIIDAQARTGRQCRVTFNLRYSPPRAQIKDILMSGEIGDVLSVDFNWNLNTGHGADYFRRWHSQKKNSGGLMVHKATHHFDLVNWWLGAIPISVMATGKRDFYTPSMARRFGLQRPHERCWTCPEQAECGFYFDLAANPNNKALYLNNEKYDGYFRDQCVFRPEIDIEDTMNVIVGYDNGTTLSYSLNAFAAWEGYQIAFNGTRGRLEHTVADKGYFTGMDSIQKSIAQDGVVTRIIPLRKAPRLIEPWIAAGTHGGGDAAMFDDLFLPDHPTDKFMRAADHRSGAYAVLIGIAANMCFASGTPVDVRSLVKGLAHPDYPPMPTRTGPVPMPRWKQALH